MGLFFSYISARKAARKLFNLKVGIGLVKTLPVAAFVRVPGPPYDEDPAPASVGVADVLGQGIQQVAAALLEPTEN